MMKKRNGYALLVLLLGMLIVGYLYSQTASQLTPPVPGSNGGQPQNPVQRSWEVVCQTNKVTIQNALQMYSLNHEPMKTLDLKALSTVMRLPETPAGCPCKYSFDEKGAVVCSVHK